MLASTHEQLIIEEITVVRTRPSPRFQLRATQWAHMRVVSQFCNLQRACKSISNNMLRNLAAINIRFIDLELLFHSASCPSW